MGIFRVDSCTQSPEVSSWSFLSSNHRNQIPELPGRAASRQSLPPDGALATGYQPLATCDSGMGPYLSQGLPAPMRRLEDYFPRFKLHPFPVLPRSSPQASSEAVGPASQSSMGSPRPSSKPNTACDPGMRCYLS